VCVQTLPFINIDYNIITIIIIITNANFGDANGLFGYSHVVSPPAVVVIVVVVVALSMRIYGGGGRRHGKINRFSPVAAAGLTRVGRR